MNVKILISTHKMAEMIHSEVFQPIQLGCELNSARFPDMLRDNEGENISALNPQYCELTAQYWAWKNLDADYYGFCHYRRYFNFSDTLYPEDNYGNVVEPYLTQSVREKYGNTDERATHLAENYDVIITSLRDVRTAADNSASIREQYYKAPKLHGEDLDRVVSIVDELYPDYSEDAHAFLDGSITSFCNMYVLRKDIFFDYCQWVFTILEEFRHRTDMSLYSTEAMRTPGHLSERLFGIYLRHLTKLRPELRIKEVQCVYFEHTEPVISLPPVFEKDSIPVVFAANDKYVPMFAVCLRSLLQHITPENNYDLILLQSDVSEVNRKTLRSMIASYPNVSLRFFNAAPFLLGHDLKASHHITVETYYRLLIQEIMPGYDKVLYLDCDLILCDDVADLYATDVEGYMLAAARDADFLGAINGAVPETARYARESLPMKDPFGYFQAGVLLFNEKEMRAAHTLDEWLTFASHPYMYHDQDVLNIHCEGRVKYLDMSWNVITDHRNTRVSQIIAFAPDAIQKEYSRSRANPHIIHYAGEWKPWFDPTSDLARDFWLVARETPYYEELLYHMSSRYTDGQLWLADQQRQEEAARLAAERRGLKGLLRSVVGIFFPKGSRRRETLKRLLGRGQ